MKRSLTYMLVVLLLLGAAWRVFLPSPATVFAVAGGMAAKLACSGRHISGLAPEQVQADLESYSSLYGLIRIDYQEYPGTVSAALPPGTGHSASYRDGIGCTLDIGDTSALDGIITPPHNAPLADNSGELDAVLAAQLLSDNKAGLESRALLAMHNSQIVGEAYAEGFEQTTPLLGWSMGKSLISILLGRLEAQGKLNIEEKALFDQWSDDRQEISIADLLQMTSGLTFDETYLPGSDATHMLFNTYSAAEIALNQSAIHQPGTHFAYSSGTTNLLSRLLLERTGGTPAGAYGFLYGALLTPLGMNHTVVESDPSGVFVGSSYVYASARDWGALGNLLVNDGVHDGQRLLSTRWLTEAAQPNRSENEPRYGYQLWLNRGGSELRWPDLPADAFAMRGNRAQAVMMIPSRSAVFVRLGWSSGAYPTNQHFADWLKLLPVQSQHVPSKDNRPIVD